MCTGAEPEVAAEVAGSAKGAGEAAAATDAASIAGDIGIAGDSAAGLGAAAGADALAGGVAALPGAFGGADALGTTALAGEALAPVAEGLAPGAISSEASAALPSIGSGGLDIAGAGAPPMGEYASFGEAADATSSIAAGDAVPPSVAPVASNAQVDAAINAAQGGETASRSIGQKLLDSITGNPLTAGALALNGASAISQRNAGKDAASQLRGVAKPFSTEGQALLDQYHSGKLNPGDEFNINRWQHEQESKIRSDFARRGMSGSAAERAAIARAQEQAQGMRSSSLTGLLTQGLGAMGMATGPLTNAISAQAQQDQGFMQAQSSALNSLLLLQALQARGTG